MGTRIEEEEQSIEYSVQKQKKRTSTKTTNVAKKTLQKNKSSSISQQIDYSKIHLFLIFDLIFAPGKFSWQQNKVLEKFFSDFFRQPNKTDEKCPSLQVLLHSREKQKTNISMLSLILVLGSFDFEKNSIEIEMSVFSNNIHCTIFINKENGINKQPLLNWEFFLLNIFLFFFFGFF